MFKVHDIMTSHVVAVHPDDTIDHAVRLMIKHRISGLPVIDQEDRLLGIISEFDLLDLICEGHDTAQKVCDFMSRNVHVVSEEATWVEVADIFRSQHIRRLPVVREGKLVGIVTRHDLMHMIREARQKFRKVFARSKGKAEKTPKVAP